MTKRLSRREALCATSALALSSLGSVEAHARDLAPGQRGSDPIYGQGLLVELPVRDLERSIRFYTEILGFRVAERRDDLQFVHVDCGVAGLQLGLSASGSKPPSPGSMVLNFDVAGDVDRVRAALETEACSSRSPPWSSRARCAWPPSSPPTAIAFVWPARIHLPTTGRPKVSASGPPVRRKPLTGRLR